MKDLRNPEKVKIGEHTYVLSSIPAFQAQKILMKAVAALATGNIADIPPDVVLELLSYSAIINQNGAEVQFENEELIDMMVGDPMELIELESRMVEKNFGFFGDGRLRNALSRIMTTMAGQAMEGEATRGT